MSNYSDNQLAEVGTNESWAKIFKLVPKQARILDVGCSSGNLGALLIKEKACEVIGLDIDKEDVKLAQQRLTDAYVKNIEQDSLDGLGSFDCVIFADVIEHLQNPVEALSKVRAVLKPGGSLIFSIPNMAHISVRLMLLGGYFEYTETGILDKTHIHFYDEAEVTRVLTESGYNITILDPTIQDFPDFVIGEHLRKLGLKSTPAFYKKMADSNGMIYQYVGKAKPTTGNRKQPTKRPPEYTRISDNLTRNIEEIHKKTETHVRNLESIIEIQKSQIAKLTDQSHIIHNPKLRRVIRKAYNRGHKRQGK